MTPEGFSWIERSGAGPRSGELPERSSWPFLRLLTLVCCIWLGCLNCVWAESGLRGMSLPADFSVFSPESPWNQKIPPAPELNRYSDLMIPTLVMQGKVLKGDLSEWTVPLFVIDSAQSPLGVVRVAEPLNPGIDPDGDGVVEGVPLPAGIWPDPQRDGHMILVDPERRLSWEFSRARQLSDGSWRASRVAKWDLDGPGYGSAFQGRRWWTFGASGSGMPLLPGLVRPEEIERGEIRHALLCATPVNRRARVSGFPVELCSPPAARNDATLDGLEYIPMGARLQLDPELDLETLGLSAGAKVIARALQTYGMFNGIGSADFKIFLQNLGPDGGRWSKLLDVAELQKIPVASFRVLGCQTVTRER